MGLSSIPWYWVLTEDIWDLSLTEDFYQVHPSCVLSQEPSLTVAISYHWEQESEMGCHHVQSFIDSNLVFQFKIHSSPITVPKVLTLPVAPFSSYRPLIIYHQCHVVKSCLCFFVVHCQPLLSAWLSSFDLSVVSSSVVFYSLKGADVKFILSSSETTLSC